MRKRKSDSDGVVATDRNIEVSRIDAPRSAMRSDMSAVELNALCESIDKVGLIYPLVVRARGDRFEVVAGHRRLEAVKRLRYGLVRCVVASGSDGILEAIKYDENFRREKVSEYDEAVYLTAYAAREKMKQAQVAKVFGVSEAYVSDRMKIARWPSELQEALKYGAVAYSACRELARIKDERTMRDYVRYAVQNGCTPALAKQWAQDANTAIDTVTQMREGRSGNGQAHAAEFPHYPCYACKHERDVRELVTVRVCPECKTYMDAAAEAPAVPAAEEAAVEEA